VVQTEIKKEEPKFQNKFYKSPGKAMLFSTLLPGAGQYYTGNYLKGALMTAAWGTLGFLSIREHFIARDALAQNNTPRYINHRDQRNLWLWWTAAVWVFSIADAYVSSHMYKFKEQETLGFLQQKFNLVIELRADPCPSWGIRINRFF
jgi:TM2 domain-containing membrane protein YozV